MYVLNGARVSVLAAVFALCPVGTLLSAKTLALDKHWVMEAPEDWWFAETSDREHLRVYTFGPETPEPAKGLPVALVAGATHKGATPQLIRGVSMGVARVKSAGLVVLKGTEKHERANGRLLTNGYRREVETTSGKMTLYIFTFSARKLPGEPLPNAEERTVIVHIAGKTQEEAERFMEVFETIRPAKVAQSTNSELNHETRSTGSEQAH